MQIKIRFSLERVCVVYTWTLVYEYEIGLGRCYSILIWSGRETRNVFNHKKTKIKKRKKVS